MSRLLYTENSYLWSHMTDGDCFAGCWGRERQCELRSWLLLWLMLSLFLWIRWYFESWWANTSLVAIGHHPWRYLKGVQTWHLEAWSGGGLGSVKLTVGLYHLKGLFQPKWFYDFLFSVEFRPLDVSLGCFDLALLSVTRMACLTLQKHL